MNCDRTKEVCHMLGCRRESVAVCRGESCCDTHFVLRDAGWQCEAVIAHPFHSDTRMRCPVVGSEMVVVNGQARCPRHLEVK
jgi:hypothetical protein